MSDSTNVRGFSARRVERKTHNFLRQKKEEREKKVVKEKEILQKRKEWMMKKEQKEERRNQASGSQPVQTAEAERERRAKLLMEQVASGEPRQENQRYTAGYQKQYEQNEEDEKTGAAGSVPRRDGFWRAGKWVQREKSEYPQRGGSQKQVGPDGAPVPDGRMPKAEFEKMLADKRKRLDEKAKFRKLYSKKTSKGQPVMKHRINHLLAKIKTTMGK